MYQVPQSSLNRIRNNVRVAAASYILDVRNHIVIVRKVTCGICWMYERREDIAPASACHAVITGTPSAFYHRNCAAVFKSPKRHVHVPYARISLYARRNLWVYKWMMNSRSIFLLYRKMYRVIEERIEERLDDRRMRIEDVIADQLLHD